ncbi:uncharacterized protein LOC133930536 [Phragmites australis]|uniref:uncharacterized protein LOC133930536 n=1 Tax=Phragmites australis TaxID=29695 RepID=UPI002D79AA20|nr:uncharacterized protein LOC133930536 [Phragmites australis]
MEMETEVESTWKGLFQRRVVLADTHCHTINGLLLGMLEVIGERKWSRDLVPCAEGAQRTLERVSTELALALASMGAARHLALRGGAPCPSAPLDSVDDLAGDPEVWCALDRLEEAAELATRVHDRVECARGHLRAAAVLLVLDEGGGDEGDAAPWEQSPWLSEQHNGVMELGEALSKAVDLVAATAFAREAAFGFEGN